MGFNWSNLIILVCNMIKKIMMCKVTKYVNFRMQFETYAIELYTMQFNSIIQMALACAS